MMKTIGTICVTAAIILDIASYWKQIAKVLRTKKSSQVSTTSYLLKIAKSKLSMIGLAIYMNWIGFTMEAFMLAVYVTSLVIISKYKPRGWGLFK